MVIIKSDEEIELMRKSNLLLGKLHAELARHLKPGIKTIELDKIAYEFILDHGGRPSFLNYRGYPNTLCISVNDVVIHGIPGDYVIKEGDLVSIDCGIELNGYHSDSAFSYAVGQVSDQVWELMKRTKEALYKGIEQAKPGNRVGDIGYAIENYVKQFGFSVVREMTGHGVGRYLHEDPAVPNYGRRGHGKRLKPGMTLAIEPMINMGKPDIYIEKDGWTVRTADGKPAAHYEHSVAITKKGPDILSTFKYIYEAINENPNISSP